MTQFTGHDLIKAVFEPGPAFKAMLDHANATGRIADYELKTIQAEYAPPPRLPENDASAVIFLEAQTDHEIENLTAVTETMQKLVKTPGIIRAAAMPDACPAGPVGTIPVGGVVESEFIHPGMHSADVCCSVAMSTSSLTPEETLNKLHLNVTFGPQGSDIHHMPSELNELVLSNVITAMYIDAAEWHFGTSGDGNHFAYVGTIKGSGSSAIVTHHGSRKFGAMIYKEGMRIAQKHSGHLAPKGTPKANLWIDPATEEGEMYWQALQIVREWTKQSHMAIHRGAGGTSSFWWNEHNFVFRKSEKVFAHAKGATPLYDHADDVGTVRFIPLNMAEPILMVRLPLESVPEAMGFAPHGAGRNYSRSQHKRLSIADLSKETAHIDARFYCGLPDESELPSAYKNAAEVRRQIDMFNLATVVDEIEPHGCIMAGDIEANAPWKKGKKK